MPCTVILETPPVIPDLSLTVLHEEPYVMPADFLHYVSDGA